jgi:hypothetical protein
MFALSAPCRAVNDQKADLPFCAVISRGVDPALGSLSPMISGDDTSSSDEQDTFLQA